MDRRVTQPKRATSPSWGPPPPRTQALRLRIFLFIYVGDKFPSRE